MATSYEYSSLAERTDIHKSCKSLETLLNVLNDYCEAIGNVSVLQKRLAKALRETAGMKITGEIAGNTMNASAAIFEALSDIDTKFAKIADKEYDGISTEVKKWFKKLAKEEKGHDERMSNANAKIKQAGQIYEKKSKKAARDITEEHTRYINLISTLGPEMSQEKYNHALNITQRHTSTTYSTAACLSRIADAEWLRVFEGVRRFSPTIGQLGEWRALCEGGWVGSIPHGLPDLGNTKQPPADPEAENERYPQDDEHQAPAPLRNLEAEESFHEVAEQRSIQPRNVGPERSHGLSLSPRYPTLSRPSQSQFPSSESVVAIPAKSHSLDPSPTRPFADTNDGSVRSLSAFPSPPTHFPLPPPRQQQPSQSQSSQSSSSYLKPRLTESPLPGEDGDAEISPEPLGGSPSAQQKFQERNPISDPNVAPVNPLQARAVPGGTQTSHFPVTSYSAAKAPSVPGGFNSRHPRSDHLDTSDQREFGVNPGYKPKAHTMDNAKPDSMERSNTSGSNSSMVAAMRHRYSIATGPTPATPKDVPRLPLRVSDLASRYQPVDGPSSPRPGPSPSRQLPLPSAPTTPTRQSDSQQEHVLPGGYNFESPASTAGATSALDDPVELELRQKQMELREREQEIETRARELEKDRMRLMNAREEERLADINGSRRDPEPQLQPLRHRRQRSQMELGQATTGASNTIPPLSPLRPRYSNSTTHLAPPPLSTNSPQPSTPPYLPTFAHSNSSSRQSSQQREDKPPHAPSCGCENCSIAKYRSPPPVQPLDLRPPTKPLTLRPVEKSKPGWIRRLSVPVGNAFNLDSKKGFGGIGGLGSGKNGSTTSLGPAIHQDGRRSYDAGAMSTNWSMTNLGMGTRQ